MELTKENIKTSKNEHLISWFVDKYLNPQNTLPEKFNAKEFYEEMSHCMRDIMNQQMEIKKLRYSDFLKTPYWKIISKYKRQLSYNRCTICNRNDLELHIHHKNYAYLGTETMLHWLQTGLLCVCSECHQMIHTHYDKDSFDESNFNYDIMFKYYG